MRGIPGIRLAPLAVLMAGCAACVTGAGGGGRLEQLTLASLPAPVANNAVAAVVAADGRSTLYSMLGLGAGKDWRDTRQDAFALREDESVWRPLPPVPGGDGRLAATAVAVAGEVLVFGGYTVDADGAEKSVETVHAFDPARNRWRELAPMPVPVDDAVSLVHAGRYVYLVSGWHDSGNVNLVQVYDSHSGRWRQATPWPGAPVFGHAGGIHEGTMVVCGGVAIRTWPDRRREFVMAPDCFSGSLDRADPLRIEWRRLPPHPGPPLYRAAAAGTAARGGLVLFAGGSDNPYNYNGVGYDGRPSQPSRRVFAWSPGQARWIDIGALETPSMDHRGLVEAGGGFWLLGGMIAGQRVVDSVTGFALP